MERVTRVRRGVCMSASVVSKESGHTCLGVSSSASISDTRVLEARLALGVEGDIGTWDCDLDRVLLAVGGGVLSTTSLDTDLKRLGRSWGVAEIEVRDDRRNGCEAGTMMFSSGSALALDLVLRACDND